MCLVWMHYQFIMFTCYYNPLLGFKVLGMVSRKSPNLRCGGGLDLLHFGNEDCHLEKECSCGDASWVYYQLDST